MSSANKISIYDMPFPESQIGIYIDGIDLEILALDALRIMDSFAKNGELTVIQSRVLKESKDELENVLKVLKMSDRQAYLYFYKVKTSVLELLDQL